MRSFMKSYVCAQFHQGLDENRRLDGQVELGQEDVLDLVGLDYSGLFI